MVLLDVDLPGKPTEVHLMDSYGEHGTFLSGFLIQF